MAEALEFRQGKIAFNEFGKGKTILLVHGFLGSKDLWKEVVPLLSDKYHLVCPDLPGHGKSDCFGYIHSMELLAQSVKAVADYLKIKEAVIVGHSMGGYTSAAFAELFPELLKGLVLLHSTSYADSEEKKKDRDRAIKAVKSNHNVFVRETVKNLFSQQHLDRNKKVLALAQKGAEKITRRGLINSLEGMKERKDRRAILKSKDFPVFLIKGKYDTVLNETDVDEQIRLLGKERTALLENSGHMGFLEEPQRCADAIRKFAEMSFA